MLAQQGILLFSEFIYKFMLNKTFSVKKKIYHYRPTSVNLVATDDQFLFAHSLHFKRNVFKSE